MKREFIYFPGLPAAENERIRKAFQSPELLETTTTEPTASTLSQGEQKLYHDGTDLWLYTQYDGTVYSRKFATDTTTLDDITGGPLAIALGGTASSTGLIKTGEYTGDGNATQAITVATGFQPDIVVIWRQEGVATYNLYLKTDQDSTYTHLVANTGVYQTDHIISLDTNGFTVGDGTGSTNLLNVSSKVYTYIAIKKT